MIRRLAVRWSPLLLLMLALLAVMACTSLPLGLGQTARAQQPFPDFGQAPPPDYDGPFFRLSANYPQQKPAFNASNYPWLAIDFNQDWTAYVEAIKNYAFQGNVEAGWVVQDNAVRPWYHVPWQHSGGNGREFVHGLTTEILNVPGTMGPGQVNPYGTYATGMYNDMGGWTIGQVWKDHNNPNPRAATFPVGTAVVKILFTDAPPEEVPHLAGVPTFTAWVPTTAVPDPTRETPRSLKTVRLIQIDLAVRDDRAFQNGGVGWVFATYAGNGLLGNADPWKNVEPVGMMYGNDPEVRSGVISPIPATQTNRNPDIRQSFISTSPTLPPQHLGWGGRLNGPVDSPRSSCMSCHSTAQTPALSSMVPPRAAEVGSDQWMYWFRNVRAGEAFDQGRAVTNDYSLQITLSIQNFLAAQNQATGGYWADQYEGDAEFKASRQAPAR